MSSDRDFLHTPPRNYRDDTSPSRSSSPRKVYGGLFTRSISSPQPNSPGTPPQLSRAADSVVPGMNIPSIHHPYAKANTNSQNTSTADSFASTRSQNTITDPSSSTAHRERDASKTPPSVLASPLQPLKSQISSVPRRLLVPTRGRIQSNVFSGSENSSASALVMSPPSAVAHPDAGSGRTSRHSRWGSVNFIPDATPPVSAGSPPARSGRSSVTGKLGRPRSDSAPFDPASLALAAVSPRMTISNSGTIKEADERRWLCDGRRFEVVEEGVELIGYQIYAVEKWIVERNRKVALLSVYTGDLKDKIDVTALAPLSSLSPAEQDSEWQETLHVLRREGARPRETDKGVIMVTSLANFRSDYTVVQIPDGDFLAHREQLYVNINLLRMGCSGRTVLTLQEPSDTTKERFMSMYHFRDDVKPLYRFLPTVLELVRLIQVGLSLFDMFPMDPEQQNGLLCDTTVEGIRTWTAEIGEPCMKIEPNERVADPMTISALFTVIVSMRNKLNSLGISHVPKDPFLHPRQFSRALASFINQRLLTNVLPTSTISSSTPSPPTLLSNNGSSSTNALGFTAPAGVTHVHRAYLNYALILRIDAAFEKHRASEGYKVHRVLFAKLDDITTATSQALATATARSRQTSVGTGAQAQTSPQQVTASTSAGGAKERDGEKELLEGTTDLAGFISRTMVARGKDSFALPCVRFLWSGKLDQLEIKRLEGFWADTEKDREEELRERERDREKSDSEDELGAMAGPGAGWSNKVQRKIESWAERGREKVVRGKKGSADLTAAIKDKLNHLGTGKAQLPSVVVSRDPADQLSGLSSGQASPVSPTASTFALGGFSSGHNSTLAIDEGEYQRRVQQFNEIHPSRRPSLLAAARSMTVPAMPESALATFTPEAPPSFGIGLAGTPQTDLPSWLDSPSSSHVSRVVSREASKSQWRSRRADEDELGRRIPPRMWRLKRSYSSGDIYFMNLRDTVSFARMQIDVDLCGQLLVHRRRTVRIQSIQAILQSLVQSSAAVNDELRRYHSSQLGVLQELAERCQITSDIEEAVGIVDAAGLETDALLYEEDSFNVPALWRMAQGPRQRVFAIRERVFGARGKRRKGYTASNVAGPGRFNRVQRTLDGRERIVDWLGRTESDVEEEKDLPEIIPGDGGDDDSEYEVDMTVSGVPSVASLKERAEEEAKGEGEESYLGSTSAWFLELFSKWGRFMGVRGGATTHASDATERDVVPMDTLESQFNDGGKDSPDVGKQHLQEVPESEHEEDNFETAPPSKEHSRSPDR